MVLLRLRVHPKGLSLGQQRKVYVRRTVHKESWEKIAPQIRNLKGKKPYWQVCRDAFKRMTQSRQKDAYANCGRHALITPELRKWLVAQLLAFSRVTVCTSFVLQRELAKKKGVVVEASTVRHHLRLAGYKWMRRGKARKYTKEQRQERKSFSDDWLAMTPAEEKKEVDFSLDGVILTIPPKCPIARENFLKSEDTMVWRKPSEWNLPALAGHDRYANQVPKNRMLPLWGGIGWGGFAMVIQHENRKVDAEEWVEAVDKGLLLKALQTANPHKSRGPWKILCDNESFLRTPESRAAHRRCKVTLKKIPAHSPDLNPVEMYWAWIRKQMRAMDLADLVKKRPVVGKMAFKQRLLRLVKTPRAKEVAAKTMKTLRKTCVIVSKNGGAASGR